MREVHLAFQLFRICNTPWGEPAITPPMWRFMIWSTRLTTGQFKLRHKVSGFRDGKYINDFISSWVKSSIHHFWMNYDLQRKYGNFSRNIFDLNKSIETRCHLDQAAWTTRSFSKWWERRIEKRILRFTTKTHLEPSVRMMTVGEFNKILTTLSFWWYESRSCHLAQTIWFKELLCRLHSRGGVEVCDEPLTWQGKILISLERIAGLFSYS